MGYTKKNLRTDVENVAPNFDMPAEMEARMEAGPEGIEYLAFGAGNDPLDAEMAAGWWSD